MFRHPCGAPSLNPCCGGHTNVQASGLWSTLSESSIDFCTNQQTFSSYSTVVVVAWQFPYLCIESNTVLFPAGNKSDRTNREITQEQGRQFAQENDMPFLETSANYSNNIDKVFLQLAKMLLESHVDKNPRSCEGGASSGSLVPVPCTASVQGCGSGGKPPLMVAVKTVSKQASRDKRGCCN